MLKGFLIAIIGLSNRWITYLIYGKRRYHILEEPLRSILPIAFGFWIFSSFLSFATRIPFWWLIVISFPVICFIWGSVVRHKPENYYDAPEPETTADVFKKIVAKQFPVQQKIECFKKVFVYYKIGDGNWLESIIGITEEESKIIDSLVSAGLDIDESPELNNAKLRLNKILNDNVEWNKQIIIKFNKPEGVNFDEE